MSEQQKHCFGKLYDHRAKECQICCSVESCWVATPSLQGRPVIKSGYALAIANIISTKQEATVEVIKDELAKRFGKDERNIYYYLTMLKKEGLVDVQIKGRQRYYTVR